MTHWTNALREFCSDWGLADAIWGMLYIVTLGFNAKYRDRLSLFESLDPGYSVPDYVRYTEPASFLGFPYVPIPNDATTDESESGSIQNQALAMTSIRFGRIELGESMRSKQGVSHAFCQLALAQNLRLSIPPAG